MFSLSSRIVIVYQHTLQTPLNIRNHRFWRWNKGNVKLFHRYSLRTLASVSSNNIARIRGDLSAENVTERLTSVSGHRSLRFRVLSWEVEHDSNFSASSLTCPSHRLSIAMLYAFQGQNNWHFTNDNSLRNLQFLYISLTACHGIYSAPASSIFVPESRIPRLLFQMIIISNSSFLISQLKGRKSAN